MENIQYTVEEIKNFITSTYDSLLLIINLEKRTDLENFELEIIQINKDYISSMLSKDYFFSALTAKQKKELEAIIK